MTGHDSAYVLGVSMSNHDRSACLLRDGEIRGAVAEERLDRRKRSEGFYRQSGRGIVLPPMRAITRLLSDEGIGIDDVDLVVVGRSIDRCRDSLLAYLPVDEARVAEPPAPGHHIAHAYSAYATAPFRDAAVLVIDEQGEWVGQQFEKCTWTEGAAGRLRVVRRFYGSRESLSLGMLYNVFTALTGLSEAGRPAAGKLMSLAARGGERPDWPALLELGEDGDAVVELGALEALLSTAEVPLAPGLEDLAVRELDDLLVKYRPVPWSSRLGADLAAKAQQELERAVLHHARCLRAQTRHDALAYAGGVALNCTTNARLRETGWRDVYVHPAATDDGAAVGLAYYGWIELMGRPRPAPHRFQPFTGPIHKPAAIDRALDAYGLERRAASGRPLESVARRVAEGALVCWYHGRSEWGPRALGARSIVANPLLPGITERINATVKFREPFRPFGVSCVSEALSELLHDEQAPESLKPYMLAVGRIRDERLAPVAHTDGSLRYQAVSGQDQPRWHALITAVGARTGVPAVLNTSFNTLGEPLVESPEDAVRQFLLSGCDLLVLEHRTVEVAAMPREELDAARLKAWTDTSVDPLHAALTLEAAGHSEAAEALLERLDAERLMARGPAALRTFHALRARLASNRDDDAAACHHAEAVLRWTGLPAEVGQAAVALAGSEAPGPSARGAASLAARLTAPGQLWALLRSSLAGHDHEDTVADPAVMGQLEQEGVHPG